MLIRPFVSGQAFNPEIIDKMENWTVALEVVERLPFPVTSVPRLFMWIVAWLSLTLVRPLAWISAPYGQHHWDSR